MDRVPGVVFLLLVVGSLLIGRFLCAPTKPPLPQNTVKNIESEPALDAGIKNDGQKKDSQGEKLPTIGSKPDAKTTSKIDPAIPSSPFVSSQNNITSVNNISTTTVATTSAETKTTTVKAASNDTASTTKSTTSTISTSTTSKEKTEAEEPDPPPAVLPAPDHRDAKPSESIAVEKMSKSEEEPMEEEEESDKLSPVIPAQPGLQDIQKPAPPKVPEISRNRESHDSNGEIDDDNNHSLMGYALIAVVGCFALLLFWRKRQRILACLIEGRRSRSRSQSRRRPQTGPSAQYRKLKSEVEDE